MKKTQKPPFLIKAFFLLTAFMCLGWADTWEGIKKTASTVTSVRAEFVQEKHMEILARPLVSKGIFYFQAPNSLRWEYRSPVQSILLMHDGRTKRYLKRNGAIIEDEGAHLQSMQVVLQDITQWLSGRFEEKLMNFRKVNGSNKLNEKIAAFICAGSTWGMCPNEISSSYRH